MSTVNDRQRPLDRLTLDWLGRRFRGPAITAAGLVSGVGLLAGGAVALTPLAANAATTSVTDTYTTAGTYTVTVPDDATGISLTALGGAGASGQGASDAVSAGGAGGAGSSVTEEFTGAGYEPGDTLQITVGAAGGGAAGGSGDGLAGAGGAGGGATTIYDETQGWYLVVAAGGGGGGGGSGLFPEYNGGNGGTDGSGSGGLGALGTTAAAGGSEGSDCYGGTDGTATEVTIGGPGASAETASGVGGGGGGGQGACGGSGGDAADTSTFTGLGGGGGGGGSGFSVINQSAASSSLTSGTNTGDGSASITFDSTTIAPTITGTSSGANCIYEPPLSDINESGGLTAIYADGNPAPSVSLVGAPSFYSLSYELASFGNGTTGYITTTGLLTDVDRDTPGIYTFGVEATNSAGSVISPFTVVDEGINSPQFVTAPTATATAGQSFSYQVTAAGCPLFDGYQLSGDTIPSLTINSDGLLQATPTAADVGTHTFTITAEPEGDGTPITQSFTLTVSPPPATAPGAPTIGTATAGNGSAAVSFTPSASDGGAPITGYTVTATDTTNPANGGETATGTGSPVTVTGLTNGDSYTFAVTATNSAGTSAASGASNSVIPATVPGAPTIGTVKAGNGSATVSFTPPASDGGLPITGYTVTATDTTNPADGGQTATSAGSPVTVTGLTNGHSYTFTVTATNPVGTGPASAASAAVAPEPPGRPSANLSVSLSPQSSVDDGSSFTETVTVTNSGPWPATNVATGVTVPGQLDVTADPGAKKRGPLVSWTDASLAVGASVTYTITFKADTKSNGTASIIAITDSLTVADPQPRNNVAVVTVKLISPAKGKGNPGRR
jgi:trimeric autotransporter adhesin